MAKLTTTGKDQDINRLQQENALLQEKLRQVRQRKHEKAARKAQAKLAKLHEQLQAVNALKNANDIRSALRQQQADEIHKLEAQLRLSSLDLFTAAVSWDASSLLWGPEVEASIEFVEPGNKTAASKENHPRRLRISKQPFAIGGMRLAYHAMTNDGQRFVAKRLLREATQPQSNVATFLEDASAHREAAALAAKLNLRCSEHNVFTRLSYGPVYIVQIPCMDEAGGSEQKTVLLLEEYLEGKFTKWNNNTGGVHGPEDPVPQAFSHFSYCKTIKSSEGPKLVVDIQGVVNANKTVYQLTDPAVHFAENEMCGGYGETNCGAKGIESFFASHVCSQTCHSLGLKSKPGASST